MKKGLLLTMGLLFLFTSVMFAENEKANEVHSLEIVAIYPANLESSASTIEILVKASDAVDDFCNYFNGSWVDTGLTLYCAFGGDVYTCTAYKVVRAACGINGAVRLAIEGDYEAALKKLLTSSTTVYSIVKVAGEFHLTEGK